MVQEIFFWSARVSIVIALLYIAYWMLFKNNTHFQLRRIILISSLALAVLIPFIEIEVPLPWSNPVEQRLELMTNAPESTINPTVAPNSSYEINPIEVVSDFSWTQLLLNIYFAGLAVSLALFFFELIKLAHWYYFGARRTDIQDNVITHKGIKYPFSFWKWIFIPQGTDYDKDIWEIIEKHESAHLNQYHTFDMVMINLLQCLIWYNPIIYLFQKDLKDNHEALADQSVLVSTDFKIYAQALVKVSINSNALNLGHSFALISTLSKRITAMQKQKTSLKKTLRSVLVLFSITLIITSTTILRAQDKKETRAEAYAVVKKRSSFSFFLIQNHLSEKHRDILGRLHKVYPDKDITYRYSADPKAFEYLEQFQLNQNPLFFDKLETEEKTELYELAISDSTRMNAVGLMSSLESEHRFSFYDFLGELEESIQKTANYIVFYEPVKSEIEEVVYDITEVDIKPTPVGGIEALVRAIALDIEVPKSISKKDLPPSIDFEVVINGGRVMTNIKLLTELKGSDKKNEDMYLFFGQVHNMMLSKVREFYVWKRGIKDGKEVRVRTTIAIPTKYM